MNRGVERSLHAVVGPQYNALAKVIHGNHACVLLPLFTDVDDGSHEEIPTDALKEAWISDPKNEVESNLMVVEQRDDVVVNEVGGRVLANAQHLQQTPHARVD